MGEAKEHSGIFRARVGHHEEGDGREAQALKRLWGFRSCDRCGGTIVLGEEVHASRLNGSTERLCSVCAAAPSERPPAPVRTLPRRSPAPTRGKRHAA
jgi:hypothetical protein